MKRTLRHSLHGDFHYPKPSKSQSRRSWREGAHQPRNRPRKGVKVAKLVGSPEDEPARPDLRLKVASLVAHPVPPLQLPGGSTKAAASG